MRGDLTLLLLEIIQATTATTMEILDDAVDSRMNWYARSRGFQRKRASPPLLFAKTIDKLRERQRFNKLLNKLKRDGIAITDTKNRWSTTKTGLKKLLLLKKRLSTDSGRYPIETSDEFKIIVFDIPEKIAQKRRWLREALKNLKFTMLQKSVWVGKSALPESFLDDLRKQGLLSYVEIVVVTKKGTLRRIE